MRVVSLLPSATEIVCALGRESDLVGRSQECDWPASVRSRPVVMRARALDADRPSLEIDRRVRASRERSESLYALDIDRLRDLRPDVILTQDLCGVCSVTDDEVVDACRAAGIEPRIVSLTPTRLGDVWRSIAQVGSAIGAEAEADATIARIEHRVESAAGERGPPGRTVLIVEWVDPPIVAGLWAPEMVEAAGAIPLLARAGEPGVRSDWPSLGGFRPDLVVISPCSFSVARTRAELETTRLDHEVRALAKGTEVWLADEAYFSRPGPRLVDGVELVSDLLRGREPKAPMPVEPWAPVVAGVSS
jgi:iron complex transport system substrate-binding protein